LNGLHRRFHKSPLLLRTQTKPTIMFHDCPFQVKCEELQQNNASLKELLVSFYQLISACWCGMWQTLPLAGRFADKFYPSPHSWVPKAFLDRQVSISSSCGRDRLIEKIARIKLFWKY
jgi:hypothetical protein